MQTAAARAPARSGERRSLLDAAERLEGALPPEERARIATSAALAVLMGRFSRRAAVRRYDRELDVVVDRLAARFAAWYEMFPRSQGPIPGRHGTFEDADRAPRRIASHGFRRRLPDAYPPHRTATARARTTPWWRARRPRVPYAIGSEVGRARRDRAGPGHAGRLPRLCRGGAAPGMEVALDFALQGSPITPGRGSTRSGSTTARTAPSTTPRTRPRSTRTSTRSTSTRPTGGAVAGAAAGHPLLGRAGVKTFRVDNPHTKPTASGSGSSPTCSASTRT